MKNTILTLTLLAIFSIAQATENDSVKTDSVKCDSTYIGNFAGLNVYPAFAMLGGGSLPASKMYVQFKHNWNKSSLRFSANYINFRSVDDRLDIVNVDEKITLREYNNNVYTLDARVGYERAMPFREFRFYYGIGAVGGYYHFSKSYYNYSVDATDYPVIGINSPVEFKKQGWYRADMLKLGLDISLGVSLSLSESVLLSVQYTPELSFYNRMNSETKDDADVFGGELIDDSFMNFRGDYIDLVLSVKL